MGACETTPTTTRTGEHQPATSAHTPTRRRLFLASDHRPPLAGLKLVRPRPRPKARRCGRSSLTPAWRSGTNRQRRGKATTKVPRRPRRPSDQVTGSTQYALLTTGVLMGAEMVLTDARQVAALSVLARPKCGQRGRITKSARSSANCQGVVDSPTASSFRCHTMAARMQTTGADLLAVKLPSSMRVRRYAQDGRSAHGLLYQTAVRAASYQQERCQDQVDIGLSAWQLVCHAFLTAVYAARRLFALSASARYRPPQTVPSDTQRARLWYPLLRTSFRLPQVRNVMYDDASSRKLHFCSKQLYWLV